LNKQNNNDMKTAAKTKSEKVIAQLIKWGNNPNDVSDMVSKHYNVAISFCTSVSSIANYIRTVY
jgi:hypothetical protein